MVRHADASDSSALRTNRLESLLDTPEAYGSPYRNLLRWSDARWWRAALESNYLRGVRDAKVVGIASSASCEKIGFHFNGERILMDCDPSLKLVTMERDLD